MSELLSFSPSFLPSIRVDTRSATTYFDAPNTPTALDKKEKPMPAIFDYDWFVGPTWQRQKDQARHRCARKRFPNGDPEKTVQRPEYQKFFSELEARTLVYLRDGFSYELKELVDLNVRSLLTFECEPLDDQYKVGAFVVSVLFEEIVRIEIFAVHPSEKPEDMPLITGFRTSPSTPMPQDTVLRDEPRE